MKDPTSLILVCQRQFVHEMYVLRLHHHWRRHRRPRPTSTVFKDVVVQEMVVLIMVSQWTWSGHGIPMFKARYKNKVFMNA